MSKVEDRDPGIGSAAGAPVFTPHDPDAPHVRRAAVRVDAAAAGAPLEPIWESLGYDEINWTYTRTGAQLLTTMAGTGGRPFLVRPHNVFTSGSGFGLPHWGSGNVYHEDDDGIPFYDFDIVDRTYDAIVSSGNHPLVELGFTPRDLLPERALEELQVVASPSVYSAYEAGQWAYPPRDLARWGDLVAALAQHCLDRYGPEELRGWRWELWNEPDIFYWRGTFEQFCALYAVTAAAVRGVLPEAQVGGPAVTGGGAEFLRAFLADVVRRAAPIDFVSFHTKGAHFVPWRTYGATGSAAPELRSPSTVKMLHEIRTLLRVVGGFPTLADLPVLVDECDAAVPAHLGVLDNANFAFQNTEYYPVFQVNLMKKILDLNELEPAAVQRATTWSFYFEGERCFEGTRALTTTGGVEKPLLGAYRALGALGAVRLPADADAAWDVRDLDAALRTGAPEEVDVLATRDDRGVVTVLVWRHADDQHAHDEATARVPVEVTGLAHPTYRVEHRRIDREHSNAHTVWQRLGAPQHPSPEQLDALRARNGLEALEPAVELEPRAGRLEVIVELPLPAVSLLVLSPLG